MFSSVTRTIQLPKSGSLNFVFTAGGNVQIQRVVQGLGYGLDDSAQAAAKQIRFKPAQQEGQAVDFPAIVHITFALAY